MKWKSLTHLLNLDENKEDEELETTSVRLPKRKILGDCDLQMMAFISSNLV